MCIQQLPGFNPCILRLSGSTLKTSLVVNTEKCRHLCSQNKCAMPCAHGFSPFFPIKSSLFPLAPLTFSSTVNLCSALPTICSFQRKCPREQGTRKSLRIVCACMSADEDGIWKGCWGGGVTEYVRECTLQLIPRVYKRTTTTTYHVVLFDFLWPSLLHFLLTLIL